MYLTVDFITKLLVVAKKDVILVVCDRLSKMAYFVTITKGMLVEGLVRLFRDNMWKLHKLPKFVTELTKKLKKMLEIETKLLTSFHPQIDEQTEHINQELELYLQFFVDYRQKN